MSDVCAFHGIMFSADLEYVYLNTVHESSSAGQFARRQACESSFMYMFMPGSFRFQARQLKDFPTHVLSREWPSRPRWSSSAVCS